MRIERVGIVKMKKYKFLKGGRSEDAWETPDDQRNLNAEERGLQNTTTLCRNQSQRSKSTGEIAPEGRLAFEAPASFVALRRRKATIKLKTRQRTWLA